MQEITEITYILIIAILYFVPTIIAIANKSKFAAAAILVNVFAGWTFVGWIVAIVFASISENENENDNDLTAYLDEHRKSVVWSIAACGKDQSVLYDRTYISYAHVIMNPGCVGTAITVGPYIVLA